MDTITLKIGGMTCGGCVQSVKRVLEGVRGVEKAEVSLEDAAAAVTFDAAQTTPAELAEAVEEAGFDASL